MLPAPTSGVVSRLLVNAGDQVEGEDLLMLLEEGESPKGEKPKS